MGIPSPTSDSQAWDAPYPRLSASLMTEAIMGVSEVDARKVFSGFPEHDHRYRKRDPVELSRWRNCSAISKR